MRRHSLNLLMHNAPTGTANTYYYLSTKFNCFVAVAVSSSIQSVEVNEHIADENKVTIRHHRPSHSHSLPLSFPLSFSRSFCQYNFARSGENGSRRRRPLTVSCNSTHTSNLCADHLEIILHSCILAGRRYTFLTPTMYSAHRLVAHTISINE